MPLRRILFFSGQSSENISSPRKTERNRKMPGEANVAKAGLEGIVAAESRISDVNGDKGELIYSGYDIHDLAEHSTFEAVIYLLWHGELPTRAALQELQQSLSDETGLPTAIQELIGAIPKNASPMDML